MLAQSNKRILVIFTGGTIGSSLGEDGFFATDSDKTYKLISMYEEYVTRHKLVDNNGKVEFETVCPYTTLSEQLNGEYLGKLITAVGKYTDDLESASECGQASECCTNRQYDGIIVTHGTDTLQYSAAALGLIFNDCSLPIVLVSSNYILDDKRANGLDNFVAAVDLIRNNHKGVFVAYKNANEPALIHRATRLDLNLSYDDKLYSICNRYYAKVVDHELILNSNIVQDGSSIKTCDTGLVNLRIRSIRHIIYNIMLAQTNNDSQLDNQSYSSLNNQLENSLNNWLDGSVKMLSSYPGRSYEEMSDKQAILDMQARTKAILLRTYHSGTMNTNNPKWQKAMENAFTAGVPVFLVGMPTGSSYESTKVYEKYHVKVLPVISPVTAYIKLSMLVACGINNDELEQYMQIDWSGENL